MQDSKNSPAAKKIAVILFEHFSNHCLANAVEPFRAANTIARRSLYDWSFWSFSGGTITSSSGLPVETGAWFERRPGGDFLFIMPSYGFEDYATSAAGRALRAARHRFKTLVGLDTGAWLLANAGLLERRKATIHWDEFVRFSERFPDVETLEDRVVLEADLATCGGASTAIELALGLIKQDHGALFATEVAALFMHGDKRDLQDPYKRMSLDVLVGSATALMRRTIETPLAIGELATRLKIDQRELESIFQRELQLTPRAVYKSIRLREARRLVELTNLSVAEISGRCGYQDASAMTRAYGAEFGQTPRSHRRDI